MKLCPTNMFDIFETIDLKELYGESWDGCFIKLRPISLSEVTKMAGIEKKTEQEAMNFMMELLQSKFVEGYGMKEGKKVTLKKEDLSEFPINFITYASEKLTESVSKKKLNPTTTPSEE